MFHKFEGWDKAPVGTTHFCTQNCGTPWLKAEIDGSLWYVRAGRKWEAYHSPAAGHVHMVNAIARNEEPAKKEEDKLTLKAFKETEAYQTIKRFVERNGGNPAQLGSIVKKFMKNYEEQKNNAYPYGGRPKTWKDSFALEPTVNQAFHWKGTPEGHDYWLAIAVVARIGNLAAFLGRVKAAVPGAPAPAPIVPGAPVEIPKAKVEEPKVPEPKPAKVGWWE